MLKEEPGIVKESTIKSLQHLKEPLRKSDIDFDALIDSVKNCIVFQKSLNKVDFDFECIKSLAKSFETHERDKFFKDRWDSEAVKSFDLKTFLNEREDYLEFGYEGLKKEEILSTLLLELLYEIYWSEKSDAL